MSTADREKGLGWWKNLYNTPTFSNNLGLFLNISCYFQSLSKVFAKCNLE